MDVEKKLQIARTQLLMQHPFYGLLLLGLEEKWDTPDIETCGVNHRTITYSREWCGRLTVAELEGVLAHEACHLGYRHELRRGGRDHWLWNQAADHAVNLALLSETSLVLPQPRLADRQFRGMAAEEIYTALKKEEENRGRRGRGDREGGVGSSPQGGAKEQGQQQKEEEATHGRERGNFDDHVWPDIPPEELPRLEQEALDALVRAATIAKSAGKLPGSWETLLSEMLRPTIDWRVRLRHLVQASAMGSYRLVPPNKRHLWRSIYLPALTGEHLEVAVAVDTSGSMGDRELAECTAEVRGICEAYESYRIHYFQCDASIQQEEVLENGMAVPYRMKGRGGTSYRPVFEKVRELEVACLVYLTDGYPNDEWPDPLAFPVIWVTTTNVKPPWGEVVRLNKE